MIVSSSLCGEVSRSSLVVLMDLVVLVGLAVGVVFVKSSWVGSVGA